MSLKDDIERIKEVVEKKDIKTVRTTVHIKKDVLKEIKCMIVDRDKTGVSTMTDAIDWGLRKLIKHGKL